MLTTDDPTITIAHLDTMAQVSLNPSLGSIFLYSFVPGLFRGDRGWLMQGQVDAVGIK